VLEELDNGQEGLSEVSRNARQVSRFINELIEANGADKIGDGTQAGAAAGAAAARRARAQAALPDRANFDAKGKASARPCPTTRSSARPGAARGARRRAGGAGVQGHQPAHQGAIAWACRPRTTSTTARWTISTCSTPACCTAAGRLLGTPRQGPAKLASKGHTFYESAGR
jgi:hypothetical protein